MAESFRELVNQTGNDKTRQIAEQRTRELVNEELRYILENVARYCEDQAIYDKLGRYGDFYYRIKTLLKASEQHNE